jgi:hypothetical protein
VTLTCYGFGEHDFLGSHETWNRVWPIILNHMMLHRSITNAWEELVLIIEEFAVRNCFLNVSCYLCVNRNHRIQVNEMQLSFRQIFATLLHAVGLVWPGLYSNWFNLLSGKVRL